MLRHGIRELLEREPDFQVVAEAGDGEEVVSQATKLKPDVILMDVGMPKLSGLEATKQIKLEHPEIVVLVLTIHDEDEYIMGLLEVGAAGYLIKSAYGEELIQAIRSVRSGEFVLHPVVMKKLLQRANNHRLKPIRLEGVEQLTSRETEVLRYMATGMSNKEIAQQLGVGVRTVKGHLVNVFAKMRVSSRTEAVLSALKQDWISLEDIV